MRALLMTALLCLIAVPALAVDPWAEGSAQTAQVTDPTGGATVVAEGRSGFGNPFAHSAGAALDGKNDVLANDVDAAALNAIAPAAGDAQEIKDGADAATIEPAAGVETPVIEDSGEAVEIAPEDTGSDIVGP